MRYLFIVLGQIIYDGVQIADDLITKIDAMLFNYTVFAYNTLCIRGRQRL